MTIGLAVIGYSRPDYLKQCMDSLQKNNWGKATVKVVALDFKDEDTNNKNLEIARSYGEGITIIHAHKNCGVASNKNSALEHMMDEGCEHLFLIEDDILMKDPRTCEKYVAYAKMLNLEHLNFAHHGPANVGHEKLYPFKAAPMAVYPHCVGAFSYYTRNCIEKVGYFDEKFINAWEHVEHTYRIIKADMHPPFWYFVDYPMSKKLLEEIPGSINNSSIRPRADWLPNIQNGQRHWIDKHGEWLPEFPQEDWKKND